MKEVQEKLVNVIYDTARKAYARGVSDERARLLKILKTGSSNPTVQHLIKIIEGQK